MLGRFLDPTELELLFGHFCLQFSDFLLLRLHSVLDRFKFPRQGLDQVFVLNLKESFLQTLSFKIHRLLKLGLHLELLVIELKLEGLDGLCSW